MEFGLAPAAAITAICFCVGYGVKLSPLNSKYIPLICMILGGTLGIIALFTMPSFHADSVISAFSIGIVSGWASTGAHQTVKQLKTEE